MRDLPSNTPSLNPSRQNRQSTQRSQEQPTFCFVFGKRPDCFYRIFLPLFIQKSDLIAESIKSTRVIGYFILSRNSRIFQSRSGAVGLGRNMSIIYLCTRQYTDQFCFSKSRERYCLDCCIDFRGTKWPQLLLCLLSLTNCFYFQKPFK